MKILIVDDSKVARNYYKLILKELGAEFLDAQNGMEALEKILAQDDIDLFLVDVNMPVMDGYTFVKKLRQNHRYFKTGIIVISTEAEEKDKQRAFDSGADAYLTKPVDVNTLTNEIRSLLAKS